MNYIIGVDVGTSGTKAIAFTNDAKIIGHAYKAYNAISPLPGYHELQPKLLLEAVVTCIQQVVQQTHAQLSHLKGLCFSTAMHSLIVMDTNDQPLTNAITWADSRSAEQADALKQTALGQDIYQHTGTPVHPMSPLCKISWFREQQPALFNAAAKFIGIKEYLFFQFCGQYLIDHSIASCTGLFDIDKKKWYVPALQAAGIKADQLSTPVSTTHIINTINTDYASLLGIPAAMPFIIGASDGCLANLGSHATQPGDMAITIGTSGAVRMITTQPAYDAQQRIFNYILQDDRYVTGGATNNGIAVLKWYSEQFMQRPVTSATDLEWFVQQAAQAPAGADGLLFLPYLMGERAPVWDATAKGVFIGVHAAHTQQHFMRAVIEGINYALYQVADSVQQTVGAIKHIYASGGFINSPLWLQWLCDLFGATIQVINKEDASSIGAAILGLQALELLQPEALEQFFRVQQQFQPNAGQHAIYQQYYSVYTSLYPLLKNSLHVLHAIRLKA